jgi:thiamine monophosphate kinase
LDNRWELADVGITPTTFKAGERVVVTGSPGRSQASVLYVWRLERPVDGFLYEQVGTSPRVSLGRR